MAASSSDGQRFGQEGITWGERAGEPQVWFRINVMFYSGSQYAVSYQVISATDEVQLVLDRLLYHGNDLSDSRALYWYQRPWHLFAICRLLGFLSLKNERFGDKRLYTAQTAVQLTDFSAAIGLVD